MVFPCGNKWAVAGNEAEWNKMPWTGSVSGENKKLSTVSRKPKYLKIEVGEDGFWEC